MERIRIKTALLVVSYIIALTGFFSVNLHIDFSYALIFMVLFVAGVIFDYKEYYPVPRFLLNALSLLFVLYKFFTASLEDPIIPIVEALVFLLGIKLIENKRFRDYLQIYVISIFLLAGSALISIDITFLLYFSVLFFCVVIAIVLLAFYSESPKLSVEKNVMIKILTTGFVIPVIAIPFSVFLFVVLPRTDYPIFSFLNHGVKASTGFSDSVKLGEISDIQEDESVIMRVSMPQINSNFLYWRGIVLSYFDGREWKRIETLEKDVYINGEKVKQTVVLEPYGDKYLFALDKPVKIKYLNEIKPSDDFVYQKVSSVKKRIKYEAVSVISNRIYAENIERELYLQLPDRVKENLKDFARKFKRKNPIKTVYDILNFLRDNYTYSLKELSVSNNPVVDFLLKSKKGNCEYFASAMAVLLRLNGIPSRLVAGYKGGIYNEIGKYYMVPQKNAHVWVEVYIDGSWLRIDPTPAPISFFVSSDDSIKSRIKALLDTLEYYWINMIINFDFHKQVNLFKKLKDKVNKPDINLSIDKNFLIRWVLSIFGLVLLSAVIFKIFIYLKIPPEKKVLDSFYRKLRKLGYKKESSQGLIEFINDIDNPEIRKKAMNFAIYFESLFYRDRKFSKEEIKKLKELLSEI